MAGSKSRGSENQTRPGAGDVAAFIGALGNETREKDAKSLLAMMKKVSGEKPVMWGP